MTNAMTEAEALEAMRAGGRLQVKALPAKDALGYTHHADWASASALAGGLGYSCGAWGRSEAGALESVARLWAGHYGEQLL